jgi:uncharacterized 2Fe-2S/4Fe-4S cluster protein (DUF4445 family)
LKTFIVNMQPIGRRIEVTSDASLLQAAQNAGVELVSLCGGIGACDSCIVRLVSGKLSEPSLEEQAIFSAEQLAQGYRLACQAEPESDVPIYIPPESLTAPQRLQTEGSEAEIPLNPAVRAVHVQVPRPHLNDLRADTTRLTDAAGNQQELSFSHAILKTLSEQVRAMDWEANLAIRNQEIVAITPPDTPLLGLAVDIGTTKLAAYLVNLDNGITIVKSGAMNPQIGYGEDVISRISYANAHVNGRSTLQSRVVEALNQLVSDLCNESRKLGILAYPEYIVEAVVVGNTAMHHLFAGLPVQQLGAAPYVPVVSEAIELRSHDLGLNLAPGAYVYIPPNIAGYVGADHVSMVLATNAWNAKQTTIALDIGTNTEITLVHQDHLWSCSCASGPAFEGAHISAGMRAAPGAVERVQITGQGVRLHTIGDQPPVGICGSGILDVVAEMLSANIIDTRGALHPNHPMVRMNGRVGTFILASAEQTGNGREIQISRQDIHEIQLAKGAIRAGIDILLENAGINAQDVQDFIIAGAFGTYINVDSAIRIGMFPNLPLDRFRQVGNAAGAGAKQMLISTLHRTLAVEIATREQYIELSTYPHFTIIFSRALFF